MVFTGDNQQNFQNLQQLLRTKSWKAANEETILQLLLISGRMTTLFQAGRLTPQDLQILFQLLDASGRMQLLESFALKLRQSEMSSRRSDIRKEIQLLIAPLNDSDRDALRSALQSSKLNPEEQDVLVDLLVKTPFPPPGAQADWSERQQKLLDHVISGWKIRGWYLTDSDIQRCSFAALQEISRLWAKYSLGYFGFSKQYEIWTDVLTSTKGKDFPTRYEMFGDRVGWRVGNSWIPYEAVKFALPSSQATTMLTNGTPNGHLPTVPLMGWWGWAERFQRFMDQYSIPVSSTPVAPDAEDRSNRDSASWNGGGDDDRVAG